MYLTIKQHDMFRTLLMGFEIPFRSYISHVLTTTYKNDSNFETAMIAKKAMLSPSSPQFLKDILPDACSGNKLKKAYHKFETSTITTTGIVSEDLNIPMVGTLNLVTFALTENFSDLYSLFGSYNAYCDLAEKYRYARNKLDHPGCRTLEDSHLVPVLSFVSDICLYLEDSYFQQKSKSKLLAETAALKHRKTVIPIEKHNFSEMPYGESRLVCRDTELQNVKNFIYGEPGDLRKRHSFCIYGYGGVGKTALVLEVLKQIVRDILDNTTINEYEPQYILFFSAKKRKLSLSSETGKFVEQQMRCHFETAEELISLILNSLELDSFRQFHKEGLIVVDNLETLSPEERKKVKHFVETQTPAEMQFLLTSRNSEEYETNFKLAGFESKAGKPFIETYCRENSLELTLLDNEIDQLLSLTKGNTLVLVLSLRRISQHLSTITSFASEFSATSAWKALNTNLSRTPSNAYEVVCEYMYKDTFEHIETSFAEKAELFYKVLKVFAVNQNDSTDISTICWLTGESYPNIEAVIDILCNFLIFEKRDTQYSLNSFAEKYIVDRFLPDAETYDRLSSEIMSRKNRVKHSLEQLQGDIKERPYLAKILNDWQIITDIDRITAARMHNLYGDVKKACDRSGKFKVEVLLNEFIEECEEAERLTAHPYIKYQKARILQIVDDSEILSEKHIIDIKKAFSDCIYSIKTIQQYASIQQTKSYASLLWLFGQYLLDVEDFQNAIRYFEEAATSFEEQEIKDQEYFQCISKLGTVYLDHYLSDRQNLLAYLRKARGISRKLQENWSFLGKARTYAVQLKYRLQSY